VKTDFLDHGGSYTVNSAARSWILHERVGPKTDSIPAGNMDSGNMDSILQMLRGPKSSRNLQKLSQYLYWERKGVLLGPRGSGKMTYELKARSSATDATRSTNSTMPAALQCIFAPFQKRSI
jgi:hypothetical protein